MSAVASSLGTMAPAANTAVSMPAGRDARLDFFRGLALLMIFINHISGNLFSYGTLQRLGFADAAEVFVFIAGMAAIFAYRKAFLKGGLTGAFRAVWVRIRTLYLVHLAVTVSVIVLATATLLLGSGFDIVAKLGLQPLFADPVAALVRVPLLTFQPHYLDILPVYVLLLAAVPLVLAGFRLHIGLPVLLSATFYVFVQMTGTNLPDLGDARGWFLNPMAWLLLFVLGGTAAEMTVRGLWSRLSATLSAALSLAAALYVAFAFVHAAPWTVLPGLEEAWFAPFTLEANKTELSWHRLVDILAKAWLVAVLVPRQGAFFQAGLGGAVSRAGRHSLPVFVLGIILSLLASIVIFEANGDIAAQITVNVVGVVLMFGLAWSYEISKAKRKTEEALTA
jgi:hypothetical protein